MELDPLNRKGLVTHSHDFAVGTPGRHLEVRRQAVLFDHQAVVPGEVGRRGHAPEHSLAVHADGLHLPVDDLLGPDDLTPEGVADGLVAQANPQQGHHASKRPNHVDHAARLLRPPGTRRQDDGLRSQRPDAGHVDGVVAHHQHLFVGQFAEVLVDVVSK